MRIRLALATVALALTTIAATSPVHANGLDYDHLKCFKIRDSLTERRTIYLADIFPTSPFAAQSDCRLRLPANHFCVNVAKENVQVNGEPFDTLPVPGAREARDYLCYDLKCDRDRLEVDALDQFGARSLRIRKSDFLCMPANKIVPGTSPTPTPTVTPAPTQTPSPMPSAPPPGCRLIVGDEPNLLGDICGGECPPGDTCAFLGGVDARGVGDCDCVPDDQLCGERSLGTGEPSGLPMCGGFCPEPFSGCIANLASEPGASGGGGLCQCVLF